MNDFKPLELTKEERQKIFDRAYRSTRVGLVTSQISVGVVLLYKKYGRTEKRSEKEQCALP